jgi:hypothetical protein
LSASERYRSAELRLPPFCSRNPASAFLACLALRAGNGLFIDRRCEPPSGSNRSCRHRLGRGGGGPAQLRVAGRHHRPGRAGDFVGECDGDEFAWLAEQQGPQAFRHIAALMEQRCVDRSGYRAPSKTSLLRERFHWHEMHAGTPGGLANRFGVVAVVLAAFNTGFDVLRRCETWCVTERGQFAPPMVRTAAGSKGDLGSEASFLKNGSSCPRRRLHLMPWGRPPQQSGRAAVRRLPSFFGRGLTNNHLERGSCINRKPTSNRIYRERRHSTF